MRFACLGHETVYVGVRQSKDLRDILDDTAGGMATTADHYDDNESHTDSSMKGIRP